MKDISPNIILIDNILKFICNFEGKHKEYLQGTTILPKLKAAGIDIDIILLMEVLNKLMNDGYIVSAETKPRIHHLLESHDYFRITFDGRIFITEMGGYRGRTDENSRLKSLELSQHEQGETLNRLTRWIFWVTVPIAVYAIFQIIDWLCCHPVSWGFFYCICGQ